MLVYLSYSTECQVVGGVGVSGEDLEYTMHSMVIPGALQVVGVLYEYEARTDIIMEAQPTRKAICIAETSV